MKIGFVINDIQKEGSSYTTTGMALKAHKRGHEVYYISVQDLVYYSDEQMGGYAIKAPAKDFRNTATFLKETAATEKVKVVAEELDVLMLRNDPAEEIETRAWAQSLGMIFGQLAVKQNVLVLNDPKSLSEAINKMYFQHYPSQVRPKTVITRTVKDVFEFFEETKYNMVMKPLQGSGGRNVFLVTKKEANNINQIFEAISRDGYVVAQEYLKEAKGGDIRLFLMNGNPITINGKTAALHRLQKDGDMRSNIHNGGTATKARVTDEMMEIVELVKPKLIDDGMFFVGLDIVGAKLMEINVFSPGGLNFASKVYGVDFFDPIIDAIEHKVYYKNTYIDQIENTRIATL